MKQGTLLTKFVLILMFIVITVYLIVTGLRTVYNPYQTVAAYTTNVEDSTSVSGWVVRDEVTLPVSGGFFHLNLNEGDKVSKKQPVAAVYQSQDALARQEQRVMLMAQLSQLKYALADDSVGEGTLENELAHAMANLRHAAVSGDYAHLSEDTDRFKELLLRREFLYSPDAAEELGLATLSLQDKLDALQGTADSDMTSVLAPASGVFSVQTDGYEKSLTPEKLDELSVSEYKNLIATQPAATGNALGKLVVSPNWYFVALAPASQAALFTSAPEVSVRFSSLTQALPMQVQSISKEENDEVVVLLSSDRDLKDVLTLRSQSAHIICRSESGIAVPRNALRVLEDGSVGVYTVTGYTAEFKPARIVAETDASYLLEPNPSDSTDKRILRAGDEILIASAELYDGKVVR